MRTGWKPSVTMSSSSSRSRDLGPGGRDADPRHVGPRAETRGCGRPRSGGWRAVRRTLGPPGAGSARIESVQEARAPGPSALLDLFDDQLRVFEHGQVLAHRVVVEAKERGELGDIYRAPGLCDLTEDPMARWVTESPGLPLQPVGRWFARPLASGALYPMFL
jgi:hypothetical protein